MGDILEELSTPALVKAIKGSFVEAHLSVARSSRVELHDSPSLTWVLAGEAVPFLNGVFRTQVRRENVDAIIGETITYFRSKEVSGWRWWVQPDSQPPDLGQCLLAHGLTYEEGGPGMAVDLLALNEAIAPPLGLVIEPVGEDRALRQWAHAGSVGLGYSDATRSAIFDAYADLGLDLPWRLYLGLLHGEPVATSGLFLGAGVAGIYWVATVPEARRQGIATSVTLAALREARVMGYRIAILHATEMGLGVYRRLGFQEYCKMSHYKCMAETSSGETHAGPQ